MKSNVSDYLEMVQCIYLDACAKCDADVSDLRDLKTIKSRVKDEGLSFLTITLPDFCRDFEKSLENGFVDSSFFRSFKKKGSIPAFLQGMISRIFDIETGRILSDEVNTLSSGAVSTLVDSVRQVCLAFKKVEFDCTPQRVQSALDVFRQTEQSFSLFSLQGEEQKSFLSVSSLLWGSALARIDANSLSPRHGPGATAEGVSGNSKFLWQLWHERLEPHFPFLEHAYPNSGIWTFLGKEIQLVKFLKPADELPVKVTPVPKTLKGPRIIAIEPCCMQYAQQAVRDALYDVIESSMYTSGHVNFRDQSVNQNLAILSSKTGRLATIDLSDASDRVPLSLSIRMFDSNPELQGLILACRSTRAQMPDGSIVGPLQKFASMGSALCFPVEAMYFYTVCIVALLKRHDLPVTRRNIYNVSREVYVYGDDILVPAHSASFVLDHLQKYHCKVNISKTFVTGKFRESCGTDAYDGRVVTPTYLRKPFPKHKRQASEIISHVSTANLFYKRGYWRTCSYLFNKVEKIIGPLPYVSETSSVLGRVSFLGYRSIGKWNNAIQSFEVRGWYPSPVFRTDPLDGLGALQKSFLNLVLSSQGKEPISRDAHHMERSALHHAVALKRGWVTTS